MLSGFYFFLQNIDISLPALETWILAKHTCKNGNCLGDPEVKFTFPVRIFLVDYFLHF